MEKEKGHQFWGGIHPTDGYDKLLTAEKEIREYVPQRVTIVMEQTPGALCEPLVKKGDHVRAGDLVGKPVSFLAVPLHASISGTVTDVREVLHAGRQTMACIIERDGQHKGPERAKSQEGVQRVSVKKKGRQGEGEEKLEASHFTREELLGKMKEMGLVGMGGAGFPTYIKYSTEKEIDSLLINGAECEPFLTCDYRLMLEDTYGLLNGIRVLKQACHASQVYICLEDNKQMAAEVLENVLAQQQEENIRVHLLPTRYPQGGERQLVQAVLGREIKAGGLPADAGAVISNVATAKAAADAVYEEWPLTSRIVTVSGDVKDPGNYRVPVGTSLKELLERSGGALSPQNQVILGGPMTGTCIAHNWTQDELGYVTKTTAGILVFKEESIKETPCIRCQACVNVCPAGLWPYQIDFAYLEENYGLCEALYASECIACGCCSYVCPAKRELTFRIRKARDLVKKSRREKEKRG
ncbi:MAG: electron transport complex subunit RsxC [Blautia sp.]|jgi:electron transport complex protein RnfC